VKRSVLDTLQPAPSAQRQSESGKWSIALLCFALSEYHHKMRFSYLLVAGLSYTASGQSQCSLAQTQKACRTLGTLCNWCISPRSGEGYCTAINPCPPLRSSVLAQLTQLANATQH